MWDSRYPTHRGASLGTAGARPRWCFSPLNPRCHPPPASSENKPFIPFVPADGLDNGGGNGGSGGMNLLPMVAMAGLNTLPLMPGGVPLPPIMPKRFMHTGPCIVYGLSDRQIESDINFFRGSSNSSSSGRRRSEGGGGGSRA